MAKILIQQSALEDGIDIIAKDNALDNDGNTVDEKICTVYSVEYVDLILESIQDLHESEGQELDIEDTREVYTFEEETMEELDASVFGK